MRLIQQLIQSFENARAWVVGPSFRDLTFAVAEGTELCLDLYLPLWKTDCPLVLYLHGGGWIHGSYKEAGARWLSAHGFAVASVQYRFTDEAQFPAQIHDVKAAIRWLRAHRSEFGYNTEKIGVLGVSSGGHLAMLAGARSDKSELEGQLGDHLDEKTTVDAVINYFGASDLILRSETQPSQTDPSYSVVHRLLGSTPRDNPSLAKLASPAFHITSKSAPIYVIHGEKDEQVLVNQAHRIIEAYQKSEQDVLVDLIPEGGHGGQGFSNSRIHKKVVSFLKKNLANGL